MSSDNQSDIQTFDPPSLKHPTLVDRVDGLTAEGWIEQIEYLEKYLGREHLTERQESAILQDLAKLVPEEQMSNLQNSRGRPHPECTGQTGGACEWLAAISRARSSVPEMPQKHVMRLRELTDVLYGSHRGQWWKDECVITALHDRPLHNNF